MTPTAASHSVTQTATIRRIIKAWWPLAASWLLMAVEIPVIGAVMARLANPEINLAAYGGIVMPLALIIESPIIMLLAASTTLSKDWDSYQKIRRYMLVAGLVLTVVHALVAFTPLYYVFVKGILGSPAEIVEPGRLGLMIMLPWSWAIAYRRFNQGVLIRFGYSRDIGVGTAVRLGAEVVVLLLGSLLTTLPGIAVGAAGVAMGVMSESAFIGWRVQPVLRERLRHAPPVEHPLTMRGFMAFYMPLVMTALLSLAIEPLGSAAISRMPGAIASLAVWPVIHGILFMLQSPGIALNEVVVTFLDERSAARPLRTFTFIIMFVSSGLLLLMASTPLAELWFSKVAALTPPLVDMARTGLWLMLPMPAMAALQSWFQGTILHSRRTRGITESVVIYLVVVGGLLLAGVSIGQFTGLYAGLVAFTTGIILQSTWLGLRSRGARRQNLVSGESATPQVIATP